MTIDQSTADAFANSWNNLPSGTVYTSAQAAEWFAPLTASEVAGRRVLELGCGNGSLLMHMMAWQPAYLEGRRLRRLRALCNAEHECDLARRLGDQKGRHDCLYRGDTI
jgi:hypothetical protein